MTGMGGKERLSVQAGGATCAGWPVVINVEASGFGPGSYPIEVGVVLGDGGGYCVLVKPEPEWTYWEPGAEGNRGLTRELLFKHGLPVAAVAHQLNTLLEGMTVYTEALGDDTIWLDLLFSRAGQPRLFRLESLCSLLPEDRLPLWDQAKREIIEAQNVSRRRASADARILQLVAERCTRDKWSD